MKKIYVGNLPLSATTDQVVALFEQHGTVDDVTVMVREDGVTRGFAFVMMPDDDARVAVAELDGHEFMGQSLRVNESRDRGAKAPRRAW